MTLKHNRVTVQTPGVPVRLSYTSLVADTLMIAAIPENATRVVVGDNTVRAREGEINGLPYEGGSQPNIRVYRNIDLGSLYVDAVTAGDGVLYEAHVP